VPSIIQREVARREILRHFDYLEENASLDVALRFLSALTDTIEALARMPRMAPLCGFARPDLRHMRRWPVKGFENWLIFYLARRDGVEIVHVMHSARDIESLLGG
jgi:toxin ParE1/3/4